MFTEKNSNSYILKRSVTGNNKVLNPAPSIFKPEESRAKNEIIQELTLKLTNRDRIIRKQVICELGRTLHAKALGPLCNIALFDKDEQVRTVAISVIADIVRANPIKMRSFIRKTFVIHNVLNSCNKFLTLKYINALKWFFSSINLDYEEEEAIGLKRTILGKRDTVVCNIEIRQGLSDLSNIILSRVKCNKMKLNNSPTPN
ncbi:MAG: hypothetical protein AABY49_03595 [Planctomycetota bacterium]